MRTLAPEHVVTHAHFGSGTRGDACALCSEAGPVLREPGGGGRGRGVRRGAAGPGATRPLLYHELQTADGGGVQVGGVGGVRWGGVGGVGGEGGVGSQGWRVEWGVSVVCGGGRVEWAAWAGFVCSRPSLLFPSLSLCSIGVTQRKLTWPAHALANHGASEQRPWKPLSRCCVCCVAT